MKNERGLYVIPSVEMVTGHLPLNVKVYVHPVHGIRVSHVFKVFTHTFQVTNVVILLRRASINANPVARDSDTEDPPVTRNVYRVLHFDRGLPGRLSVTNPEIGIREPVKRSHSPPVQRVWKRMAHCATNRVVKDLEVMALYVRLPIQENTRRCTISRNKNNWVY